MAYEGRENQYCELLEVDCLNRLRKAKGIVGNSHEECQIMRRNGLENQVDDSQKKWGKAIHGDNAFSFRFK